ncbi:MAG: NAD(P)/FAD-dependent oxidoreductase [Candidatus Dormibacteraeota bacterium]|nr:NAD(P)/FAD-dependent oxidoreductase [Candidatus Dormibacteraeota bacterium]
MPETTDWDAIVVGASFAGLAAARALSGAGRVLLLDRDDVGANQTSACAAPLELIRRLGLEASIEQVHEHGVVHLPSGRAHPFDLPVAFATFDYRRFCTDMRAQCDATFVRAAAHGLDSDGAVRTPAGRHRAPVVVDASGWRAVLAPSGAPRAHCSTGLEARLEGRDRGLHFWLQHPAMRDGYLWDFPAGEHRRVGILTYRRSGRLRQGLDRFSAGASEDAPRHGGALPARLRRGVAGGIFLAGDAAGQCLPFSGEGIRPALVFGDLAGRLGRQVLAGDLTLAGALRRYRVAVRSTRLEYACLEIFQWGVGRVPTWSLAPLVWLFGGSPLSRLSRLAYMGVAPSAMVAPAALAVTP